MKILLLAFAPLLIAAVPNPPPLNNTPVVDAADLFEPHQEEALNARLRDIKAKSKYEIAVLTVPIEALKGYEIDDYSLNAARFYGLGGRNADDGVLITIAKSDVEGASRGRIEVGEGLEMLLTDATAGQIFDDHMIPSFMQGEYPEGIVAGVDAIAERIVPLTPEQIELRQREAAEAAARNAEINAAVLDGLLVVGALAGGGGAAFGLYRLATAPARRRRREAEEAERLAREAREEEERAENRRLNRLAREATERMRQAAIQRAAEQRQALLNSMSPGERAEFLAEERRVEEENRQRAAAAAEAARVRAAEEAERAEARRAEQRRIEAMRPPPPPPPPPPPSYDFGGGGGSFGGGGASRGW